LEKIDFAFKEFQRVSSEVKLYKDNISSEQDTRLKVINRILIEVLSYPFESIFTENKAGSGFLDYKISINDLPKLIIEAKKDGIDFSISDNYNGRAFNLNGPVFKDEEIQKGLDQSIYYAAYKSVELACLTNGKTWIIFRANRFGDGKDVLEGRAFVFSSLESIEKEFKLFYDLLSPEAILDLRYRAIFQEAEGTEIRVKDFRKSIKDENSIRVMDNQHSHDFDVVMNEFFSKLSFDTDPELLTECFVETKESKLADKELSRISEDLVTKIKSIETAQGELLKDLIERAKATNRHEFVILIGNKGAGKSTFVERFFKKILPEKLKKESILVRVNLAESDGNTESIIDWLNHTLLDECEKVLYNGKPTFEEIQGMFHFEYERLKTGTWKVTYNKNKTQFKIDFGKHIENRRETRPNEYIKRMIGDMTMSRFKIPCIVFDNTDHFGIEFQEKVFQFARSIYEKEVCLIIVPITDKTSWQLSKQGAIQSFENEVLYLPVPSAEKIIEKRIEFLEKKIKIDDSTKKKYFSERGIKLEIKNIEKFVKYLQGVFSSDLNVARWIGDFANYDIRRCLELTRDLISSPHLSIDELLATYYTGTQHDEVLQINKNKIKNALIKRIYNSYPIGNHPYIQNLFYITGNLNTSPLLGLRILQLLIDRKNERTKEDNYLIIDQVLDYFNGMGVDRSIILKHLDILLKKGLIYSYDPTILDIDKTKRIEISPSGYEHYFWCLNDNVYLLDMAEVTPITDANVYSSIERIFYNDRNQSLLDFLDHLENEDKLFCHIPSHPAYKGQLVIANKIENRKNQLVEWINRGS
jgi:hypothetical protein